MKRRGKLEKGKKKGRKKQMAGGAKSPGATASNPMRARAGNPEAYGDSGRSGDRLRNYYAGGKKKPASAAPAPKKQSKSSKDGG